MDSSREIKQEYFMTKAYFISIEINAYMLLYIIELVKEKILPAET